MRRRTVGTAAFTLIELLVVIAIIAILAAILFPVFSRAREKARQSTCLSNVRQINLGLQQYTQDYDERFPVDLPEADQTYWQGYPCQPTGSGTPIPTVPDPGGTGSHFVNCPIRFTPWTTQPYTRNFQLFHCPSLNSRAHYPDNRGWAGDTRSNGGSYGWFCLHYNSDVAQLVGFMAQVRGFSPPQVFTQVFPRVNVCSRSLAESQNPSNKPVLFCNSLVAHASTTESRVYPPPYGTGQDAGVIIGGFADGHAKILTGDFGRIVSWGLEPF
jgi:prepilin-type N-terminal cleavage/methylation domain-containing protein